MGKTGSIIWLCFAALALIYLMSLAIYAAFKNLSSRAPATIPPAASPSPPQPLQQEEITENVRLDATDQNPTVECSSASAGFLSLIGGRKYQEDSLHVGMTRAGALAAVVCDGMGGLQGGAQASAIAVKQLFAYIQDLTEAENVGEFLKQAAQHADLDITDSASGGASSGGTTSVMVMIMGTVAYWMSVGDSRIYILRSHELHQITRDHNYELELKYAVQAGDISPEEAASAERPDALISYLGMGGVTLVDTGRIDLEPGDIILLCSDGLFKALSTNEISQTLDSFGANVSACAQALVTNAVRAGGAKQDNTTAVVIAPKI